MIRLEKVSEDNYKECLSLKVSKDQVTYVSSNETSLAKAYVYYDKVTPIVIYNDDLMVGFIMLRFNEQFNNYFIWQFMIDERFQGKGYGKEALNQVIEWIKKENRCLQIVITCKEGNEIARKLYTQLGFQQMGEVKNDEYDMILLL